MSFILHSILPPTDADRPQEGDLVFHPIVNKIFQINFVDHDEPFSSIR